jgi:surfeit locus 1 family protein
MMRQVYQMRAVSLQGMRMAVRQGCPDMRLGSFQFTPGLWPSLATLAILPVLLLLGSWQLERASWKQALVDAHAGRAQQPAVSLTTLGTDFSDTQYRTVLVSGRYDLDHQLLLDNRIHQGYAGYEVLTPLRMDNGSRILVNRGWVLASPDRSVLPDIPAPDGRVRISATVKLPPEKIFRLDEVEEADHGWPRVVQQIEMQQLEHYLGYEVLPVLLLLDKDDAHGFVRAWKPVYGVTPDKHRAYAMQWYTLALVLVLIYIGVNTKRDSQNDSEQQ